MFISIAEAYQDLLDNDGWAYWFDPCCGAYSPFHSSVCDELVELAIVPGSFNPIHDTHREIYNSTGVKLTAFELSITRIDKPPVSLEELENRLAQFKEHEKVLITNAPRMIHKLALLRSFNVSVFIGMDTILRMANDYGQFGIAGLRANFIVCDRIVNGEHLSYPPKDWVNLPGNVHRSHLKLSKEMMEMSSTDIRSGWQEKQKEISKKALAVAANAVKAGK